MAPTLPARARLVAASLAVALVACTEPGRIPTYPDAEEPHDRGFYDANPPRDGGPDSGEPDGEGELYDSGEPPPEFPFTGQYQIAGDQNRLYAREARGRLSIVIGAPPYVYDGTIAPNGDVNVVSGRLVRSGCSVARITGSYQRRSATMFLELEGCGQDGTPFRTSIRGGFEADYDPQFSGLYQMGAVIMDTGGGCYTGPANVMEMLWGVSMVRGTNSMAIHVAYDLIPSQAVYVGRLEQPSFTFAAIENVFAQPGLDVSMRGNLTRAGLDPPIIQGTRDVYDPLRNCGFSIGFRGAKFSDF